MTERIRELALQAGFTDFVLTDLGMDQEVEKFAELIVQECLCKIKNEAAQYHEPVWSIELINDIKDHFGVRE